MGEMRRVLAVATWKDVTMTYTATGQPLRRWASLREAAAYLGVHIATVRRMVDRGDIHVVRVGPKLVRVDLCQIDRSLESQASEPGK